MSKSRIIILIVILTLLIGVVFYLFCHNRVIAKNITILDEKSLNTAKYDKNLDIASDGDEGALNIIEYGSFSCYHCGKLSNVLNKIKKKYKNKVRIVHRNISTDLFAFRATKILHCLQVDSSTKLQAISLIYRTQSTWIDAASIERSSQNLLNILQKANINIQNINKCIQNNKLDEKIISEQKKSVHALEINATPMTIIGNKVLKGYVNYRTMNKIVKKELKALKL